MVVHQPVDGPGRGWEDMGAGKMSAKMFRCLQQYTVINNVLLCRRTDNGSPSASGWPRERLGGHGGRENVCQNVPLSATRHR